MTTKTNWAAVSMRSTSIADGHYPPDTGCDVSLSCLCCPLPQCKYDAPTSGLGARRLLRNESIIRAYYQDSKTVDEICRMFRISERTVYRILEHQWTPSNDEHEGA